MVKVFLVDDHEVVRRGLIDLLSADPELEVIGEAGSVAQALARIPALQPDVAVLDVRLPDGNGIELCRELLSRLPDLRCLMLTSFTSDEAMLDAILAGASGYVVKDIKGMELAEAIKEVGAGRSLLDNRAAAALMAKLRGAAEKSDPLAGLSDQERVLLDLLGEGLTNKQIAARMFLAEKTVKNYVSRLLAKLGMERRTQAAVFVSKLDQSHRHPRGIGHRLAAMSGRADHQNRHACRLRNGQTDRTQRMPACRPGARPGFLPHAAAEPATRSRASRIARSRCTARVQRAIAARRDVIVGTPGGIGDLRSLSQGPMTPLRAPQEPIQSRGMVGDKLVRSDRR